MPISDGFHAELQGIAKILANDELRVQRSQRPYAWQKKHVGDLYSDLEDAIASTASVYYLGTILLRTASDGILEVIDGQQRLATTVILLSAIRNYLEDHGHEGQARGICEAFLAKPDTWTRVPTPRLQLGATDHEYFMKTIVGMETDLVQGPQRPSQRRLKDAAELAAAYVHEIVEGEADPVVALKKRVDFLESNAKALVFRIPESMNPYTVFETINARGLTLSDVEKLKNHVLGLAGKRLSEAEHSWSSMVGVMEAVHPERSDDNELALIRHLESSRFGVTRNTELYRQITNRVSSQSAAIELADEYSKASVKYAALLSPSSERWQSYGTRSQDYCDDLNEMGMVQVRPLLLAILLRFEPSDVERAMSVVVSTVVRLLVSGKSGSGALEERYATAAKNVQDRKVKNAAELAVLLAPVVPSDTMFHRDFSQVSVSKSTIARYYLRVLEQFQAGRGDPALVPNPDPHVVNVEHILPKNPSMNWPTFSDEQVSAYRYRLGNLALCETRINAQLGNMPFDEKTKRFGASPFRTTSSIVRWKTWDIQTIEERQLDLAKLALKAWPLK